MTSPTKELQGAIYDRLRLDANVIAAVGSQIYDQVPDSAGFPRITFGPKDLVPENFECIVGNRITVQIDVWAREPGMAVDEIAEIVRVALLTVDVTLTVNAVATFELRNIVFLDDPDGLTKHAAMYFEVFVEQP